MKHFDFICFMLTLMPLSILGQITIDDALLDKSEMLKLNQKFINKQQLTHQSSIENQSISSLNINSQFQILPEVHILELSKDGFIKVGYRSL